MAPSFQKEIAEAFAPARLFVMYGVTEASAQLSYLDPDYFPRKWGSKGFLFVVGRTKDMIKIGGNRVSPKEIEEALQEHPAVVESAVIGVSE